MENILELKNINKRFPGVLALKNVNMTLKRGEVHALVGENGAGKSTLMKVLSGIYIPEEGEIIFENNKIKFSSPKDAQKLGINIIHQEFSLVPYLNAVENIFLGREITKKNGLINMKKMIESSKKTLERIGVNINLNCPVINLSVAEQQFIEIAKALSINTKILILDEPTATLTPKETDNLFKLIKTLKKENVTMIYISHHLEEIFEIADNLTVLRDGEWINSSNVKNITKENLIKMMVGRDIKNTFPSRVNSIEDKVILEVKNLKVGKKVNDVSFYLKKGEILGISGLVGSGRTETVRALIGADKTKEKNIFIDGKKVNLSSPQKSLSMGIGLIPENRKTQGLILGLSVKENSSLATINKTVNKFGFIKFKEEEKKCRNIISELNIKTPSMKQEVINLSGGNQQKVVLAKWLNTDCRILIFDEPTRGIDVGAKEEIYHLMNKLTENGISIIMISSELPEVMAMSDRLLIMQKGKSVACLEKESFNAEKIMLYATGGVQN